VSLLIEGLLPDHRGVSAFHFFIGLYHAQKNANPIKINDHPSSHSLLQIAAEISNRQVKRVNTIHGFECLCQILSVIDIDRFAIANISKSLFFLHNKEIKQLSIYRELL